MKATGMTIAALAAVILVAPVLPGQDVCIHEPITVREVRGNVAFEVAGKRGPLSDVAVEVSPFGYKKPPIATTVTKQDGKFSLPEVRAGRYRLSLRHAVLIGLSVEMRVKGPKQAKGNAGVIEIVLRNDPAKHCAGNTVVAVTESRTAAKFESDTSPGILSEFAARR